MLGLSRLMPLLLDGALAGARHEVRRNYLPVLIAVFAGLFAMTGLAMLVGSAFLCLAESMTPPAAAAVTGGGLLVAAGLIALIAQLRRRARPRRSTNGDAAAIAELLAAAETAISRGARAEAPTIAVMALLAGCALGASPKLRRVLIDLVLR